MKSPHFAWCGSICCNPSYSGSIGRIANSRPVQAKLARAYLKNKINTGHRWLTPVILATWETEIRRIAVSGQANSSQDPISKITRAKWTEGEAQAVEHLLFKYEPLSSNPSPTNKINKNFF
jgi:hypothetical protein